MSRLRRLSPDAIVIALLILLPLILFWQQTLGGKTLLPTENLYQYEPFATYREVVKAPIVPHNHLLSDLVLQNYQWKSFIRQQIDQREIPLWNPHQFAGIPFLAAGQHSALYPLSLLYYILPLPAAYGWFTVLNLGLAGIFMFLLARGLGMKRPGAAAAGIVYQLAGFMLASVVFPMMIAGAVWLPLLLLMTELILRDAPILGRRTPIFWVMVGAGALGCNILAGHAEMTLYTLLITAYYAAARIVGMIWRGGQPFCTMLRPMIGRGLWIGLMIVLGVGLASVQFIPLLEFVQTNWRTERSSLDTVLSYAHPVRDALQFFLPNFYGSPAHHSYFDLFSLQTVTELSSAAGERIPYIDWGIKNYVEGALYLGILPLILTVYGLAHLLLNRRVDAPPRHFSIIFVLLAIISLLFMFGTPVYGLLFALPGINQLNSPFRWVFALTLCVAILAGFGLEALLRAGNSRRVRRVGQGIMALGGLIFAALLISRLFFDTIEPLLTRLVTDLEKAAGAFSGARMFYSYQFGNVLILGGMLTLSGLIFWRMGRGKIPRWLVPGALALIAVDLMIASWGFNPASDPLLLDFTPPAVEWLLKQPDGGRFITLDDPAQRPIMQANAGMHYGLQDVRGYDSIISAQYVEYMRSFAQQPQLDANRIAPLYTTDPHLEAVLHSRQLDLLNVRYLITHKTTTLPDSLTRSSDPRRFPDGEWRLAYEDEAVRIWAQGGLPPAFVILGEELSSIDDAALYTNAVITRDTGREKFIDVEIQDEDVAFESRPADADGTFSMQFSGDPNETASYQAIVVPGDYLIGKSDAAEGAVVKVEPGFDQKGASQTITASGLQPGETYTVIVTRSRAGWLFVSETYAPGWRAFVRPQGAGESAERPYDVELILDNFQGVYLTEAGKWTVRLVYSPSSLQIGLFGSILSGALLLFFLGVWFWRTYIGVNTEDSSQAARVARNSIAPILLNLFNKGIDFAFLLVMLRLLSPEQAGTYFYLVVIFVWFDIFTNFGLDLFIIREVSREKARAGHYLYHSTLLRAILSLAGIPLLIGFVLVRQSAVEPLATEALLTLGLLYVGLFPASLSKGMSSLFYAFERAEYPAAIATITTMLKAVFGALALLLGYGILGLAAVSIFNNFVTLAILVYSGRSLIGKVGGLRPENRLLRKMTGESWPLMLNHFLATIFFQVDIVILEWIKDAGVVARYSVAYKWVLAINIIPAFFTQALMPMMSRQARENREALKQTYSLGIKLLVMIAFPLAVGFTFLAAPLTEFMGGQQYLPDGAIAIQLMIWSIPIGWMNSLTQYALIAVDLQRAITRAFFGAVLFNILTNLILIPQFSFQAAALTTIASELILCVFFGALMQRALGKIDWIDLIWRPAAAAALMIVMALVMWSVQPLFALAAASTLYLVALARLRPLNPAEMTLLYPLLPGHLRQFFPARSAGF